MASEGVGAPTTPTVAPYGEWLSPITSAAIVAGSIVVSAPRTSNTHVYWLERRPQEGGRVALVRRAVADGAGEGEDFIKPVAEGDAPFNVRSRVHEYGGGEYAVLSGDGGADRVAFVNFRDQRVYLATVGGPTVALTPEAPAFRYADFSFDVARDRLIAIQEYHPNNSPSDVVNTLVAIPLTGTPALGDDGLVTHTTLASGCDFYSSPRVSPDGTRLAYVCWNHPNMPWDKTALAVASFSEDGTLNAPTIAAGNDGKQAEGESILQPEWAPNGALFFISDRTNWWNLYVLPAGSSSPSDATPVLAKSTEFGGPSWRFGTTYYGVASNDTLVVSFSEGGKGIMASLDVKSGALTPFAVGGCTQITYIHVHGKSGTAFFVGGSPVLPSALRSAAAGAESVMIVSSVRTSGGSGDDESKASSQPAQFDVGYFSTPEQVEFDAKDGHKSYAYFYPPTNRDYSAPEGELPPVLVKLHGGPTSSTSTTFRLSIQYWTSRGFAVLDVNYGGSTGYGREYRNRLKGNWGVVDVDDCCSAVEAMVAAGRVDGKRAAVTGGSAGGYTVLAALTRRSGVFTAGASYYGVSSLEALATDTHKFESRYLDELVGPWPQAKELYKERSPITHVASLSVPVVFFQGSEDKIVPPDQATAMYEVIKGKGFQTALVVFEGEGHGFRKSENIRRSLDGEFFFYGMVWGFAPAEASKGVDPKLPVVNSAL